MELTIVIPFRNGNAYLPKLLDSIPAEYPVIIVNDNSSDPPRNTGNAKVLHLDKRGYFSGAVNEGIRACTTDVLILNQDSILTDDRWQDTLINNDHAIIGDGVMNHPAWTKGYVMGTFMFMRRNALDDIGLLDERYYPLWGTTCEWQLRACRAGYAALPLDKVSGYKHLRHDPRYGDSIQAALRESGTKRHKNKLLRTPPEVSVIVPNYNYGRYLPDLVNSLIGGETSMGEMEGQTFKSFEIVLVDDVSTDESREIITSLVDPWKAIRGVFRETNGGTPAANNSGIRNSYGYYITVLCADDMMSSDRLEYMYHASEKYQNKIIYDNATLFADGEETKKWKLQDYDFESLLYKNHIHCGIMYTRKAIEKVGGYPEIMRYGREDWAVNIAFGIEGFCGLHLDKYGYLYRREKQNRTLTNTSPKDHDRFSRQIQSLYPNIYQGERPPMCCGSTTTGRGNGNSKFKALSREQLAAQLLKGGNDMPLIEYIGKSEGAQSWYGPVTGTQYSFGKSNPVGPVQEPDLQTSKQSNPGLLEMRQNGKPVFRLYKSLSVSAGEKVIVEHDPDAEIDEPGLPFVEGEITDAAFALLKELELPQHDIDKIEGSGADGKIVLADIKKLQLQKTLEIA